MESKQSYAFRVCGPMITQNLDPMDVLDDLLSEKWVSDSEYRQIHWLCDRGLTRDGAIKLMELLRGRTGSFECFVNALDDRGSYLAEELKRHFHQAPDIRRREHSLSDLRETLIDGAVPDVPIQHVSRRKLVDKLSNALRALADRFKVCGQSDPTQRFARLGIQSNTEADNKLPTFSADLLYEASECSPPPTSSWLLVHGMAGSGKTVLCSYALRRNPGLLAECFPGGVIWLQVGPLTTANDTANSPASSPVRSTVNAQLVALVDKLERKITPNRFSFGDRRWSEFLTVNPLLSQSPPSQPATSSPSLSLSESLDRLRRALIKRQQRNTWGPDDEDFSSTSLLLIVLDDVWDVEVGRVLSNLPGAFLVTSRDQNVLQHVATPVDRFPIFTGFSNEEVAQVLAIWTDHAAEHFLPDPSSTPSSPGSPLSLHSVSKLCHGLPFATTLLGDLLRERYHRLSEYVCDPTGSGQTMLNWLLISRPSAYGYETLAASVQKSIDCLPDSFETYYEQLVIFEPTVVLTAKVTSILWSVKEDFAERILSELTRFSLATRIWLQSLCCYGFIIHPLQLDLLKLSISPAKQAYYHAKFIEQYKLHCGGRWARLVASGEHIYFWHQAISHLFKSGRLQQLIDLMTDLEFLRSRLSVLGTSLVIAEFNRYRAVFVALEQMDYWFAYLRFIQTNAYYVVDPASVQPTKRGRSPYRTDSRVSLSYDLDSVSPALRTDGPAKRAASPRRSVASSGPKGLDLIQLGLGLPYNSPVFQQAVQWLLKNHQLAKEANESQRPHSPEHWKPTHISEYYWFWCNSHVAASQLVWAIPTGPHAVTCMALEPAALTPSEDAFHTNHETGHRERFLVATRDGRVLLLDAVCGYEVAVQQTYPPSVEVKFLAFFPNKSECLTCGSDGNLVVSTLPPPEPIERVHQAGCTRPDEEHTQCVFTNGHTTDYASTLPSGDLLVGVDVDEDLDASPKHPSPDRKDTLTLWDVDGVINGSATSHHLKSPKLKIGLPTVLADITRLTEVIRVDGVAHRPSGIEPTLTDTISCIAAPPDLSVLIFSCQTAVRDAQLPSVYFLKRTSAHLYLDCSRQLALPVSINSTQLESREEPEESEGSEKPEKLAPLAILSTISTDANFIGIVLDDGHIWIYSLEAVGWVTCYSTQLALGWAAEVQVSKDRKRSSDLIVRVWKRVSSTTERVALPASCLFLPRKTTSVPSDASNSTVFAAAVATYVLLWDVPDTVPSDESTLADMRSLMISSKPIMSLSSSTNAYIICLDACLVAGHCVLAGGTTNGRVLFWRTRDGCRLFELTAHATWVTAVRLLPTASNGDNRIQSEFNLRDVPLGVLTASANGVLKRWDVGAACLPSPTTPLGVAPPWPSVSHTIHRLPSVDLEPSSLPTTLHGLWTDVFSVWFGSKGSLVVIGRRRHSSDLQFVFRPQQHLKPGSTLGESLFTFQEITMEPSQSFYWRTAQKASVRASINGGTNPLNSGGDVTPTSRPRPNLSFNKHWIMTTGLPGTLHGRATAVAFWPCGRWVAVGFSTGIVQVLSLHFDEIQLFGIVKRYSLVDNKPVADVGRSESGSKPVDRVVFLHTWQSDTSESLNSCTLAVVAVFASGSVAFWHIPGASTDPSTFESLCVDVTPEAYWPPMHSADSTDYKPGRRLSEHEVQTRVLSDTDVSGIVVPVTWSAVRQLPHRATLNSDASATTSNIRTVLAWLTAGYDGMVYGRQIIFPASNSPSTEVEKRPNREFTPWRLDLNAHAPCVITDADVDPTGEWLLTASTDQTAKVWSLVTSSLVFETAKHPDCVRTVSFRPVLDQSGELNEFEWFFGTGDDAGTLRIWSLTSAILQHERTDTSRKEHPSRALSPDAFMRPSTRKVGFLSPADRTVLAGFLDSRPAQRRLSPELHPFSGIPSSSIKTITLPPRFHSSAAGYGGTWLRRLVWSSDGRLLAGLSDRLCVWPFESSQAELSRHPTNVPRINVDSPPLSSPSKRRPLLHRCRVLRVLSSGVSETVNSSLNLLKVSSRMQLADAQPPHNGSGKLSDFADLPPTLVTVDAHTGTLYIFDPIGALFRSELISH